MNIKQRQSLLYRSLTWRANNWLELLRLWTSSRTLMKKGFSNRTMRAFCNYFQCFVRIS